MLLRWLVVASSSGSAPFVDAACSSDYMFQWDCNDVICLHNHTFSMSRFQRQVRSFYLENKRPPFNEAFFLVQTPPAVRAMLAEECPNALICAHFLATEIQLFSTGAPLPYLPSALAINNEGEPEGWPMEAAAAHLERLLQLPRTPSGIDVVLSHCDEDLSWLTDRPFPMKSRLYVYEKCGRQGEDIPTSGDMKVPMDVRVIARPDPNALRLDECSAYLSHIVREYDNVAGHTVFLQSDPQNHLYFSYLDLIFTALSHGFPLWTVSNATFLPLTAPRHVQTVSACINYYYRATTGKTNTELLSPYCCAHFLVTKEGLHRQSQEYYLKLLDVLLSGHDACVEGSPVRSTQCYMLEFLWHVIFGDDKNPPLRCDDERLASPLRMKDGVEHVSTDWPKYFGPRVPPHPH